ncbi:type VII secretion target [Mycobacterium avium subsp. hominissuis]|uniref:type VII secretion target n=1 Tax=Mycobacterium avium TaxID=1764 RepID=UPI0026653074|nr:type VII secretion target [Mycobacterium avium]MDO2394824.1 type VII secretion target [Mycobacterium avium subsp. hominissuis]
MGQLNVNPADLYRAADDYTELATATAHLSTRAAAEIERIATTHGPMGYPIAVGIAMGMAARERSVQTKSAQFGEYADRFTTHAGAYIDEDRRAAAVYDALHFPQMHVDPKPPPKDSDKPWVVCWLPSPDADPAKYCPADTTRIEYVDDKGQWIQKDIGTGANQVILNGSLPDTEYLPGPPSGPPAPGTKARLWPDEHGNLVLEQQSDPNRPPLIQVLPPGQISW